jgi:hypothetical protein
MLKKHVSVGSSRLVSIEKSWYEITNCSGIYRLVRTVDDYQWSNLENLRFVVVSSRLILIVERGKDRIEKASDDIYRSRKFLLCDNETVSIQFSNRE